MTSERRMALVLGGSIPFTIMQVTFLNAYGSFHMRGLEFALMGIIAVKVVSALARFGLARSYWARQANIDFFRQAEYRANKKAVQLLRQHLNLWQRWTLWATGSVTVWGGGLRLRINIFKRTSSCVIFMGFLPLANLCVMTQTIPDYDRGYRGHAYVPRADEVLAIMLAFKSHRSYFWKNVVSAPPLPGMGVM